MGIAAALGVSASGLPALADKASAVLTGQITAVGPTAPFAFRGPMNLAIYASVNTALTTTKGSLAATVASATGLAAGAAINSANAPPGATVGVLAGTNVTIALPPVTLFASGLTTQDANIILPPGSNVASLVGATVTVDAEYPSAQATLPANTTVTAVIQADAAPTAGNNGIPGIVTLSAAPTASPTNVGTVPLVFVRNGNAIATTGADANAIFTGASVDYNATVQIERSFDGGNTFLLCNIGDAGTLAQFNAGTPVAVTFGEPEREVLYRVNCIAYVSGTINYRISQTGGANEAISIGPLCNG